MVLTTYNKKHIIYLINMKALDRTEKRRSDMKDVVVLRDLEQIKAISHPYRIEILACFEEKPATAKQIADKMGEPHAKINYHIKTLQKMEILQLVDERAKSGIIEKYYLPTAKKYVVYKAITNSSEAGSFERSFDDYIKIFNSEDCELSEEEIGELVSKFKGVFENFIRDKKRTEK